MKKICFVVAAFMVVGILQGCGSMGPGSKAVEITVVSPFHDEDGNRDNFVNAYKAYEAATGNKVNDEAFVSNEAWKAEITSEFEKGREPDILFYFTGADADRLIESGKLVSLSDIRREYPDYASNMKDSMMPVSTADGRQYAVPVNGYWEGLYLNRKVLADCGVAVPGADYSWEQFLKDCEAIKEKGCTPVACSLADVPHYWFEFCVFNNGNISNHLVLPRSSGDNAGRKWAAGLMDIKELYDKGYLPGDTTTASDSETSMLMIENKAAFLLDGSWKLGWFSEKAADVDDFLVTYVPAKGERKPTEIIGGLSMGYYITKKAWDDPKKREACVGFIEAMTTDEVVSSFGALSVTALKNGTSPPDDADSLVLSALEMNRDCTGVVSAVQDIMNVDARKALFGDIKEIAAGQITPESAIDECLAVN